MKIKKTTLVVIGILVVLTLPKLYKINGGFVPAQPDERTYAEVVRNFHQSFYPNYDGVALYNSPPLFHYLSFGSSFFVHGYYLPLRVLSLLSSFLLSVILYFYLKTKFSITISLITTILFGLLPITVYFSRLGLLEVLVSLFSFLAIVSFEETWKKKSYHWALVSGLSFGFGLITKYSILPLATIPILVFIFWVLKKLISKKGLKNLTSKEIYTNILLLLVIYLVAFLVSIPVFYLNYLFNPVEFKNQFKYIFGLGGRPIDLQVSALYLVFLKELLSVGVLLTIVVGIATSFKKIKNYLVTLLSIALLSLVLVRIGLFETRYLVILTPFLMVLLAAGLEVIVDLLPKRKKHLSLILTGLVLVLLTIPTNLEALKATYHTTIEEVGNYVREQNKNNLWVASNYWPSAFVNEVGYKTTWLTNDKSDAQAFSGLIGSQFISPAKDTLSIILEEGGFVILESPFSETVSASQKRIVSLAYIQNNYSPIKEFVDKNPQWPYFEREEKFTIYKIPKKN